MPRSLNDMVSKHPSGAPRSHIFCFCVPVRVGVLVLTSLTMVWSAMVTILAIYRLFYLSSATTDTWVLTGVSALVFTAVTIIAAFGLCGAVYRKRKWVGWYGELIWCHLWLLVFFGLFGLICVSLPGVKDQEIEHCIANVAGSYSSSDALTVCSDAYKIILLLVDLTWAVACVIELWLVLIVSHYTDQLFEEEELALGTDLSKPAPYPLRGSSGKGWQRTVKAKRVGPSYSQVKEVDPYAPDTESQREAYRDSYLSYV